MYYEQYMNLQKTNPPVMLDINSTSSPTKFLIIFIIITNIISKHDNLINSITMNIIKHIIES